MADPEAADLTSQLTLQLELERARTAELARLARAIHSMDAAFIELDRYGVIRSWNAGATATYGYTVDEALGRHVDLLIPAPGQAALAQLRLHALSGEPVTPLHAVRRHKDGSTLELAIVVSPVRDDAGTIVGVSEVAHQVAIASTQEEAAYRLAAIVESSDDVIVSKDLNGIVTTWNRAAERMFGYTAAEMIGRSITTIIPTERLGEEDLVLSRIRAGLTVDHFETIRRRKDGSLVEVSLSVSPVKAADGRIIGASKIARDITERKRLAEVQRRIAEHEERAHREALEAENRRIQEASRIKNEFVANMSHELRTPLHAIIGFAEVIADERLGPVTPAYREIVEIMLTSSRHLLQLINDILDLAKLESGRIEFHPESIVPAALLSEVESIVKGLATRKQVEVVTSIDPAVDELYLDPAKLKQVLYNYISNAIKFTAEGGRVDVRVIAAGDEAFTVEVQDTGIGIPEENQHRLFVEFQQLDPGTAKRYPGTGLGLALTKRIVEAQGGTVGCRSRAGEGSTFFATLPRKGLRLTPPITSGAVAETR